MKNDQVVKRFIDNAVPLLKKEFHPVKILIFGSRVNGRPTPQSDLDIIVVSDAFTGIPLPLRMGKVLKIIRFERHVDIICYTPNEFERMKNNSIILSEILPTAEEISLV